MKINIHNIRIYNIRYGKARGRHVPILHSLRMDAHGCSLHENVINNMID